MSHQSAVLWSRNLVDWYAENKRMLPWRRTQDAYHVWVSEIMLQQTRIEAVMGYYHRFMEAFPNVEALAAAPIEQVLKLWEGLGYYSRARNLYKAAQQVVQLGGFPTSYEEILKLPGIGDYTAGAIAAIAFGEPVTAIDGNVMRVVSRIYALEEDIMLPASKKNVKSILESVYPPDRASDFVQGLMELGELICIPGNPRCESCPIQQQCRALAEGKQTVLPLRLPKTKKKIEERIVLIAEEDGKVLLTKRPEQGLLGGLWEYPNVLADSKDEAIEKFLQEYGLKVSLTETEGLAEHVFTHIRWKMQIYKGKVNDADGFAALRRPFIWASREQLEDEIMLPVAFSKIKW